MNTFTFVLSKVKQNTSITAVFEYNVRVKLNICQDCGQLILLHVWLRNMDTQIILYIQFF